MNRHLNGVDACDHPRLSASEIEPAILAKVAEVCRDPRVRDEVVERLDEGRTGVAQRLAAERKVEQERIDALTREARDLLDLFKRGRDGTGAGIVSSRIGEIELELDAVRSRASELDDQMRGLTEAVSHVTTAIALLDGFDELWAALVPEERLEIMTLLIDRIDVDELAGQIQIAFHDLAAPFPQAGDWRPETGGEEAQAHA